MQGKSVIVTGGSGAIGSAAVSLFIEAGATVTVADRVGPPDALTQAIGDKASRLRFHQTDLTGEDSVRGLIEATVADTGGVHALLNVAGGFRYGPAVEETSEDEWDSLMQLNLKTAFLAIKHALPVMKAANYGRIVSVAARSGLKGDAMVAPYAVSKGGVILLTQSAADEVMDYDITVNAVLPSIVDTLMNRGAMPHADFSKWVAPRDLAEVMLFLASDRGRSITGAAIPVYNKA